MARSSRSPAPDPASPPAKSAEAAKDDSRREQVLRAARVVFELHGLEGASMRTIAQAALFTTGAIYPYFKGKEEIYAELLSRSLEAYRQRLVADVQATVDPRERLGAALMAHFEHYVVRPDDMALALYLFNGLRPQGLNRELDARLNRQLESIMVIFRDAVLALAGGPLADVEAEVGMHYAMLFGLLLFHHTRRTRVLHIEPREVLQGHIRHTLDRFPPSAPRRRRRTP